MNRLNGQIFSRNHVFAGFGNPLLDISAILKNGEILNKFNLKPDGQSEVNEHDINEILKSLERSGQEITTSPGGCVQNTLRVIQTLLKQPELCVFFGGVGSDSEGAYLESEVKKCGLEARYTKHSAYSTGKVAALINGDKRSLVAHLGAAEEYHLEHFNTTENLKILEEEVLLVYIEGFFITHSLDVTLEVIQISRTNGVIVAFNISGAYVAEVHAEKLLATVTLVDIIIGNDAELRAFGRVIGLTSCNLLDLALETYSFLCKENSSSPKYKLGHMDILGKLLIVTQGKDPVFCVCGNKEVVEFSVPPLDTKLIKDTTGAGDSFAAGFLVAFVQGKPMTECLSYGCAVAHKVIQQVGVSMPDE